MYCSNCGLNIDDEYVYCPECGSPLFIGLKADNKIKDKGVQNLDSTKSQTENFINTLVNCPNCGTRIEEGYCICPICGATVLNGIFMESQNDKESASSKSSANAEENHISEIKNGNNGKYYCTECGAEIRNGNLFCPQCGTKVFSANEEIPTDNTDAIRFSNVENPDYNSKQAIKRKEDIIRYIVYGTFVLFAFFVIVFVFVKRSHTIDLNDFISVEYSGYDTKGYAEVVFDTEAFLEKYGDKIKIRDMDERIYDLRKQLGNSVSAAEIMIQCIDVQINKVNNLTNGDAVTTNWSVDDDIIRKEFNYRLNHDSLTHEVIGLNEVVEKDIFEGINVNYYDYEPYIGAYVDGMSSNGIEGLDYRLNKYDNLSNGDSVRVTVTTLDGSTLEDYCIEHYGIKPVASFKDYIVTCNPGCYYVEKWSDLTQDAVDDFFSYAKENVWNSINGHMVGADRVGQYSGTWTTTSSVYVNKSMILIYHLKLEVHCFNTGGDGIYYPEYYMAVPFYNVLKQGNKVVYSYESNEDHFYVPTIEYYPGIGTSFLYIGNENVLAFKSESEAWDYFRQFDCRNIQDWEETW